jgi:UDP-N-acetylglucosamine:LPS N-acetylglucosamine transferase
LVEQLFCKQQVVSPNLTSGSMNKKRILVLTDHMPWGHRAIAKAIYSYLKSQEKTENFQVFYVEVKAETGPGNDIYAFLCRYLPSAHRIAYKIGASKAAAEVMADISLRSLKGLKWAVGKYKPDLIISTYFLHSHCLARWREDECQKFKLWTVVADPRSIALVSFDEKADLNLVYDEVGIEMAKKYGIPLNRVLVTGWWTRLEMFAELDRNKMRRKLGFTDDRPIVFVGGGSLGTGSLTKILPALMVVRKKVGLIFNTGTDKMAFNLVSEYIRLFRKLRKDDLVQIKNLGWIDNMAEVLAASDLTFGKAGPNFMFDVVAREIPFVAITHIGGQEDGNIDLLREKKLGWVKEKGTTAAQFFLDYVDDPKKYNNRFKDNIKKEAARNRKTMGIILERVRKDLEIQKPS